MSGSSTLVGVGGLRVGSAMEGTRANLLAEAPQVFQTLGDDSTVPVDLEMLPAVTTKSRQRYLRLELCRLTVRTLDLDLFSPTESCEFAERRLSSR